jgi:hypothetical protein
MTVVFTSCSRKDSAFAWLYHLNLLKNDSEIWIDWRDIPPIANWLAEV